MTPTLRLGPPIAYSPITFQAGGLYHPGFWLGVEPGVRLPIRIDVSDPNEGPMTKRKRRVKGHRQAGRRQNRSRKALKKLRKQKEKP